MKRNLLLILILVLLMVFFVSGILIRSKSKPEEDIKETETKQEIVTEPVKEENKETEQEKPEETIIAENDQREVYRMLDFDRRLILSVGQQDEWLCSIFDLAYARSILDNRKSDPYDYYDGDGAVWSAADYERIGADEPLNVILQKAYDNLSKGKPVIFYVSGNYGYTTAEKPVARTSSEHYVLLIGYKEKADYQNLKASDFYAADPSNGYCCDPDAYMPWITLTDDAPLLENGMYYLFGPNNDDHVETILGYPDRYTWDNDQSQALYPEKLKQE